jgi:hypothetical protein
MMSGDFRWERMLQSSDPNDCLMLYGSYARGDFNAESDIDVLRVAEAHTFKEDLDEGITVHTYALADLLCMADQGSLFVLHLLQEGVPLQRAHKVMSALREAYRQPRSYVLAARRRFERAIRLLDVDEPLFEVAPQEFVATAYFLCRSLLYAHHADAGPFSFSLPTLAKASPIAAALRATKHAEPTYEGFLQIRAMARSYMGQNQDARLFASMSDLAACGVGDSVFEGLALRIATRLGSGPYDAVSTVPVPVVIPSQLHVNGMAI